MSRITIGFSRPKSSTAVFANLIMAAENTPYSHVYIKWYSETLSRYLVYEARGGGVNFTNHKLFKSKNKVVKEFSLKVTEKQKLEIVKFCVDNARTEYGYLQVIGIGLARLLRQLGVSISNPFKNGNICSELAAKILKITGVEINEDLDLVGPKFIYEILSKHKNG